MDIILVMMQYLVYGFEVFIWWRLTKNVLDMKYDKKFHMCAAIIMFVIMLLKHHLNQVLPNSEYLQVVGSIILMCYTFITSLILFKNSLIEKFIWWGVFYFGLIIMEIITIVSLSLVMNKSVHELSLNNLMTACIIVIAKMMTVLLFEAIIRKRTGRLIIGFTYSKELIFIVMLSIALLLGAIYVYTNTNIIKKNIDNMILIFFGIVFFITLFTIALIFKIEEKSKEEMATKLKLQQIELELKLNDDMINITDKLRKLRHDMNNHIGLIKTLVQAQKYEDLTEYIDQIYEDVEIANDLVITENKTLSVLLNAKKSKAREKNIDFQSMIAMQDFNMQNKDVCALLGNILDNAIEAAEKAERNKYINLTIQKTNAGCIINCENTLTTKPMMRKGKFVTSKENSFLHGIGTETIKDIVAKYKGEVCFDYDDEMFNVKVVMPI